MNRAFQNKCGSTLGKLLLVTCIDIPNKIASHTCFVTDTAFPWMCNNQNPVREISKVFLLSFFFFSQEKTIACSFIPPAQPCIPTLVCCMHCLWAPAGCEVRQWVLGHCCQTWPLPDCSKIPQPVSMQTQLLSLNPHCDTQCLGDAPRRARALNWMTPTAAKYCTRLLRQHRTFGSYWWWVVCEAAWWLSKGLRSW